MPEKTILERTKPFEPPKHPGDFNESAVKIGNLKDPAKIAEKIETERKKHERHIANYEKDVAEQKAAYEANAVERAPLSPVTGEVVAIGYKSEKGFVTRVIGQDGFDEGAIINEFWARYQSCVGPSRKMVGHNIFNFDLPFLIARSWVNDITIPKGVIEKDRFWNERVWVDTMKRWSLGRYGESIKLDTLSNLFGGTRKPEEVTGAMFYKLIKGTEPERKSAIDYLINDLEMTWKVATAMGVM